VTPDQLIAALQRRKVWKRGTQRAPHKALLLLQALGSLSRGDPRLRPYEAIADKLKELLNRFGPPRQTPHPEAPFTRLEPEFWEIQGVQPSQRTELKISELHGLKAGFPECVAGLLKGDSELVSRVANLLLESEFEESYHGAILDAVGLTLPSADSETVVEESVSRDPNFSKRVIQAYQFRCAVCGFGAKLYHDTLALEAAHIQWRSKGGPNEVPNGLALCAIHRRALARGGISLDDDLKLLVSPEIHGYDEVEPWFFAFEGQPIRPPRKDRDAPGPAFLAWHRREVFRGEHQ